MHEKPPTVRELIGVLIGIGVGIALAVGTGNLGVGIDVAAGLAILFGGAAYVLDQKRKK